MIALATLAVVALLATGVTLAVHLAMPGASHHLFIHVTISPNGAFTLHPERDGLTCLPRGCGVVAGWQTSRAPVFCGVFACPALAAIPTLHTNIPADSAIHRGRAAL
jgi:hypothetical protein